MKNTTIATFEVTIRVVTNDAERLTLAEHTKKRKEIAKRFKDGMEWIQDNIICDVDDDSEVSSKVKLIS